MTKTTILMLPGTGFPQGDGITEHFLGCFDPSQYETRIVSYPAAFGGLDMPYGDSRAAGRTALLAELAKLGMEAPVILAGYSQGAVIAGDLAAEHPLYNIRATALIADGKRPGGAGVVPEGLTLAEGYGIAGTRDPHSYFTGHPWFWVSAWGDPISALPAGNPLRTVADLVEWYSIRSPEDMARWGADCLDKALTGRLQDWWNPIKWQGWAGAAAFARGYLWDGRHTTDYVKLGYTRALAEAVMKELEG